MQSNQVIETLKAYDLLGKLIIDIKPNKSNFVTRFVNTKQGTVLFFKAQLENGQILNSKFIKY